MNKELDFSGWHLVPEGAEIPVGTRVLVVDNQEEDIVNVFRWTECHMQNPHGAYYTEEPIPDPLDERTERLAERLYYAAVEEDYGIVTVDDAWEYSPAFIKDQYRNLAKEAIKWLSENS